MQVRDAEAASVTRTEMLADQGDDLRAVVGSTPFEHLGPDVMPDLPVELGERGVSGDRELLARILDHHPEIADERGYIDVTQG